MSVKGIEREFKELCRRVDELKSDIQQAKGALKVHEEELRKSFDCATLEEAKVKLVELRAQAQGIEAQVEEQMAEIKATYGDLL